MKRSTFETCLLAALLVAFLSGCVHVDKKEEVVKPAPVQTTPPPP